MAEKGMKWPWSKRDRVTLADLPAIMADIQREADERNRVFDEYLALPDRPRPKEWRPIITGSPLVELEGLDWEHYRAWLKDKRNQKEFTIS